MTRSFTHPDGYPETEHFSTELEVQCECGQVFEPSRAGIIVDDAAPAAVTLSCCCPRCGEEVLFDEVDERTQTCWL